VNMASLVSIVVAVAGAGLGFGSGTGAWARLAAAKKVRSSSATQILSLVFLGIFSMLGTAVPRNSVRALAGS
jgi:hypothetical protein